VKKNNKFIYLLIYLLFIIFKLKPNPKGSIQKARIEQTLITTYQFSFGICCTPSTIFWGTIVVERSEGTHLPTRNL
jgi:hypothetical protein